MILNRTPLYTVHIVITFLFYFRFNLDLVSLILSLNHLSLRSKSKGDLRRMQIWNNVNIAILHANSRMKFTSTVFVCIDIVFLVKR